MPIYEYQCQDCHTEFELIRSFKDADNIINCTHCQGKNIQRNLSRCNAVSSGKALTGSGGCAGCSGGSCSSCSSN